MAQRVSPLRVTVPLQTGTLSSYPSLTARSSSQHGFPAFSPSPTPLPRQRPREWSLWAITWIQIFSLYAVQHCLRDNGNPGLLMYTFWAFLGSALLLSLFHRPWEGRALSTTQVIYSLASAGLLVLSFLLRLQGFRLGGRLESVLAEYAGAVGTKYVLGSLKRNSRAARKLGGLITIVTALFLLSQGWAKASCSPLSFEPAFRWNKFGAMLKQLSKPMRSSSGDTAGYQDAQPCIRVLPMLLSILVGALCILQKTIAGQISVKSISRKRQSCLNYGFGTLLLLPVAVVLLGVENTPLQLDRSVAWSLLSTIGLGLVGSIFGEAFSEEKLQVLTYTPRHFLALVSGVCIWELLFDSSVSLVGFLFCSLMLGIGTRQVMVTSGGLSLEAIADQQSSLHAPTFSTLVKTPLKFIVADSKTRKIGVFLLLSTAFMVVEFVFGFHSNSLGLISDACHMLFDCAALAIGLYASYISKLQANSKFNYGYGRFEIISGYVNAVFLILVASLIVLESLERILDPPEISTESLLLVSVGGFLVNMVGLIFFHETHHHHGGPCSHSGIHNHDQENLLRSNNAGQEATKRVEHHHTHDHLSSQLDYQGHPTGPNGEGRIVTTNCDSRHVINYHDLRKTWENSLEEQPDQLRKLSHRVHDHSGQSCAEDSGHMQHRILAHGQSSPQPEMNSLYDQGDHIESHNQHGHDHHHNHHEADHSSCKHGHKHEQNHEHDHKHRHGYEHAHKHMDHNMQGIFLHILADTLGSLGVVVSTVLIKYKGWSFTDPACSIFISALIIASVMPLVRNSAEVLLQRMPHVVEGRLPHYMREVEAIDGVKNCQGLHVWSLTSAEIIGSLHLHAAAGTDRQRVRIAVADILKEAGIADLTIQVENV